MTFDTLSGERCAGAKIIACSPNSRNWTDSLAASGSSAEVAHTWGVRSTNRRSSAPDQFRKGPHERDVEFPFLHHP